MDSRDELYQATILDHNRNPRNFHKIPDATYVAEGYNPLCGDHLHVYCKVGEDGLIADMAFEGSGCAISKASASMMTAHLKGRPLADIPVIFQEFHDLVIGKLKPAEGVDHKLGKLAVFSGIWQYPSRVKCASLGWHTLKAAMDHKPSVSTE